MTSVDDKVDLILSIEDARARYLRSARIRWLVRNALGNVDPEETVAKMARHVIACRHCQNIIHGIVVAKWRSLQ